MTSSIATGFDAFCVQEGRIITGKRSTSFFKMLKEDPFFPIIMPALNDVTGIP